MEEETCWQCDGSGYLAQDSDTCECCDGRGYLYVVTCCGEGCCGGEEEE